MATSIFLRLMNQFLSVIFRYHFHNKTHINFHKFFLDLVTERVIIGLLGGAGSSSSSGEALRDTGSSSSAELEDDVGGVCRIIVALLGMCVPEVSLEE